MRKREGQREEGGGRGKKWERDGVRYKEKERCVLFGGFSIHTFSPLSLRFLFSLSCFLLVPTKVWKISADDDDDVREKEIRGERERERGREEREEKQNERARCSETIIQFILPLSLSPSSLPPPLSLSPSPSLSHQLLADNGEGLLDDSDLAPPPLSISEGLGEKGERRERERERRRGGGDRRRNFKKSEVAFLFFLFFI